MPMDFNNSNMAGVAAYGRPQPQRGTSTHDRSTATADPAPAPTMTQASQASSSTKAAATHGRSQYPRPEAGPQYKLPNESEINDMVEQVNRRLEPRSINMTYKRHEGTDRYFLTIYNSDTKEVIREIPSEWSLDLLATLWEMTGLFMNKKG